ncbi:hypothetical protein AgCh_035831 [Apium graveolens]
MEQWNAVIIESDCLPVVQLIRSSIPMRSSFGQVIEDCRRLSSEFNNFELYFIKRSANMSAHELAQVCECAHLFWNNDSILGLIMKNRKVIMRLIFLALEQNSQNHRNRAVLNLTQNLKKMFSEMDCELLLGCQDKFEEENSKLGLDTERRILTWERLENDDDLHHEAESPPCVVVC